MEFIKEKQEKYICVMCGGKGELVSELTDEILCKKCALTDEEAWRKEK